VNRTRDTSPANDSFDLDDLIGSLTGGNSSTSATRNDGFNFQNLLNHFTGNADAGNSGGGFDLQDIIGQVTKGAQQNQAQQAGDGGLLDMIKGSCLINSTYLFTGHTGKSSMALFLPIN
jgi:hypothetical protein